VGESRLVTLSCPNCAGSLTVGPTQDLFACGFCGANVKVERSGGTISLSKITDAMARLQRGADKTAAELALPRLKEELRVAEGRLLAFRTHADGLAGRERRVRALETERDVAIKQLQAGSGLEAYVAKLKTRLAENRKILDS
jgi:hypothetical protein